MTEAEWLGCIDPHPMVQFLRGSVMTASCGFSPCPLPAAIAVVRR